MDSYLDPFRLSKELGALWKRSDVFLAGLGQASAAGGPFGAKEFPGKTTFDQVRELDASDPFREPLLRLIFRLTERRLDQAWVLRDAELSYRTPHPVSQPVETALTLSETRKHALTSVERDKRAWWGSLEKMERPLSDHRVAWAGRDREIAQRLGVSERGRFWDPLISEEEGDESSVFSLAREVLNATASAADHAWGDGWIPLLDAAMARDAVEGWPARLAPDTLRNLLAAPELFRGVHVDPGRLPQRWAPMSFPRAAAQVGRALTRSIVPPDLPLAISRDVDDLLGHQIGQLFLLWTLAPPFQAKVLGLSRSRIASQERALGGALCAHLRISAARILVKEQLFAAPAQLRETWTASMAELTGEEWGPSTVLSRVRIRDDEEARFCGLLSAGALFQRLTEEHDEDWWRNPRAQEFLRAELLRPAPRSVSSVEAKQGLAALVGDATARIAR